MKVEKTLTAAKDVFPELGQIPDDGFVSVCEVFEAQADRTPEAIAITFGDDRITYRELNERAIKLSGYLKASGLAPNSLCGIALERSADLLVGVLAILKSGAAYVPLDPAYPSDRLLFMMADTQMPMLISQSGIAEKLTNKSTRIVLLDEEKERIGSYAADVPGNRVGSHNAAYVIFTSGSTGKPKGLVMSHGPLLNLLRWQRESSLRAGDGRKTVQFASLSFDVSFQEMFSTWGVGGTLVLITEEMRRDVRRLWQLLVAEQVERLFLPPVVLQHLALAAEKEAVAPRSLREIITAGEQLKITPQIKRLFHRLPNCTLHNQYGPSETHVATAYRLTGNPENWAELTPIGRPITNVRIHILDEHLQPVETGIAGELYIGGVCLADGYLNRPGLTDERFIQNPFSSAADAQNDGTTTSDRLYRTGDLARRLPDGNFEFLGRVDHQIKIRGHRIEPGEVESLLLTHRRVREVVVTARQDARFERQLVAYVVVAGKNGPSSNELHDFLAKKLPEFMIPSAFVYLETLPLTPNGKVNRGALPGLGTGCPKLRHLIAAPSNPIEAGLVEIWERVLNVQPIGVMDNFFELGGNSLLAVAMLIEINEVFRKNVPAATLISDGTIKRLAETIASKSEPINSPLVALQPHGTLPPLFLLPPIGGEIYGYRSLATHFGGERPVYGLQARGLDGKEPPFRDLVEMATYNLEEVLRVQPNEPFLLGGYSLGGTIAFEMAQQLYAKGYKRIKLIILDEDAPGSDAVRFSSLFNITRNFPFWFLQYVARRSSAELRQSLKGNILRLTRHVKSLGAKPAATQETYRTQLAEFLDVARLPESHLQVSGAMYEALLKYKPCVYPGRIILFRTRAQRLLNTSGLDKGWKNLAAKGVEIRIVAGDHNSMCDGPNAASLASEISGFLHSV